MHRVGAGVRRHDLRAQLVVDVGVAVGREGYGDHVGVVEQVGRGEGGADQRDGGERGGAGAHQRDEDDAAEAAELVELGLGQRVDDRDEGGAGVLLADLGRA